MSGQHFSLRWNNHQSHVLSAFDALLQNESLVDCTLVCEDSNVKAHKVVLSACSPYFQKIFTDNPCKHPIIVLKDVRGWEVQCIVDFMYKGETSVPEAQLPSLLQAAESLKVRGLTSSEQQTLPPGLILEAANGASSAASASATNGGGYNGMPARRYSPYDLDGPTQSKLPRPPPSHSSQSSPMSLTHHQLHDDIPGSRPRSPSNHGSCPPGSGPRRKQARPRRRSGDSVGNSSLDLSKADSPPSSHGGFRKGSPNHLDVENTPENLSIKRPASSSPAINLVKTESLLEDSHSARPTSTSDSNNHLSSPDLHLQHMRGRQPNKMPSPNGPNSSMSSPRSLAESHFELAKSAHFAAAARAAAAAGMRHGAGEHEARVEALQALNFMAAGGGLPPFSHPGLPLPPHSSASAHHHQASSMAAAAAAAAAHRDRSASTPGTPNSYAGRGHKGQHSAPRGGPPRSWTNDDLTKALENVWNKRMTTSQASRVFGIPYNSLLMYVRGKYGKSLKLDVLKQKTPAANDNLNTIGNSRSTPKEKISSEKHLKQNGRRFEGSHTTSPYDPYAAVASAASAAQQQQQEAAAASAAAALSFPSALFQNLPALQEHMGLLGMLPQDGSRMRELMQNIHREQQSALSIAQGNSDDNISSQLKGSHGRHGLLSPSVGHASNGGGLLMMPVAGHSNSVSSDARSLSRSPMTSEQSMGSGSAVDDDHHEDMMPHDEHEDEEEMEDEDADMEEKERRVQAILLEATKRKMIASCDDIKEDKNANQPGKDDFAAESDEEEEEEDINDAPTSIGVGVSQGGEISAI